PPVHLMCCVAVSLIEPTGRFSTHFTHNADRLSDRMLHIAKCRKILYGTVASAKATIPRRVQISTESSIEPLAGLDGVAEIMPLGESLTNPGAKDWEIRLHGQANAQTSAQTILERCFQSGIVLR